MSKDEERMSPAPADMEKQDGQLQGGQGEAGPWTEAETGAGLSQLEGAEPSQTQLKPERHSKNLSQTERAAPR